ncbi:MAG: MerR family transcriptional regulator [Lachnospiraceae bacterium]|nr:MerR family transcriptional regulator [Lachnospiraceae bacterium]
MVKEKSNRFKIGQVSRLFHVSISTLRHYDKIGLVQPEYTDEETGYRYYGVKQFEALNTIRYLRALDVPLEQITAFLQNRDTDKIYQLLLWQQQEVKRRQQELWRIERKLSHRLEQLTDALGTQFDVVTVVTKPPRRMAYLKENLLPKSYLDLEHSIRQLEEKESSTAAFLGKVGLGIAKERLQRGEYQPYDSVFIILDEEDSFQHNILSLPEETCVMVRFQGGHESAVRYYEMLMEYIKSQHYAVSGFSKEITMIDYGMTNDESKFVTEIQIPVDLSETDVV